MSAEPNHSRKLDFPNGKLKTDSAVQSMKAFPWQTMNLSEHFIIYSNGLRCFIALFMFVLSASISSAQVSEKKASYLTIVVPDSLGTYPMAINDSMAVSGYYLVSPTSARAFLRQSDGTIVVFETRGRTERNLYNF